jgi:hypothetical protein
MPRPAPRYSSLADAWPDDNPKRGATASRSFDRTEGVCYVFQRIIMNINIFKIIAEADIVVQLILLLLVFFSVFSWAIIFFKYRTLKSAAHQSNRFLAAFRRSKSLADVNEAAKRLRASPLSTIFLA